MLESFGKYSYIFPLNLWLGLDPQQLVLALQHRHNISKCYDIDMTVLTLSVPDIVQPPFHNIATTHLMTDIFKWRRRHEGKADEKNILVRQRKQNSQSLNSLYFENQWKSCQCPTENLKTFRKHGELLLKTTFKKIIGTSYFIGSEI